MRRRQVTQIKKGREGSLFYRAVPFLLGSVLAATESVFADEVTRSALSPVERELFDELNQARSDPQGYAEVLAALRPYFSGNHLERPGQPILVTVEGVAAVDEAIAFLRSAQPLPALVLSGGLTRAARDHVADQRDGAMGHTGSDASEPWERMNRYGTWADEVAENIAYGGYSTQGVVVQLIVDDGVPSRQHRVNMFDPSYRFVGLACGTHARLHDMCVMDFAAAYSEASQPPSIGAARGTKDAAGATAQ